ncbi:hypothetical protein NMPPGEIJ_00008 [Clostridioides phage AR1074-1]|nr:hypothetical protein NMPPGEIJ_00008 [Clostridioides phage AR1074-1]
MSKYNNAVYNFDFYVDNHYFYVDNMLISF